MTNLIALNHRQTNSGIPTLSKHPNIRHLITIFALSITAAGCSPNANIRMREGPMDVEREPQPQSVNYEVSRVGVFEDSLAFKGKRGIYEIKDLKTGKSYIGVSGIGISEKGVHSSGKSSALDER